MITYVPVIGVSDPRSIQQIIRQDKVSYRTALRRRRDGPPGPTGRKRTLDYKTLDRLLQPILRDHRTLSLVNADKIAEIVSCERRAVYRRAAELKAGIKG